MDYDASRQPDVYDAGRSHTPSVLQSWLDAVSRHIDRSRITAILDLGCGTGRYSGALAAHFDAHVVAADPSRRMLAVAARKRAPRVRYVEAAAESLPFEDRTFDLVFLSMVFHHFRDRQRALGECRRVLRPRGMVSLRAATSDEIGRCPYVPFFPAAARLLATELESRTEHERLFSAAGFGLVCHEVIRSEVAPDWGAYADRIAMRADSILERLPGSVFAEGHSALCRYAADHIGDAVCEFVDLFTFTRVAADP